MKKTKRLIALVIAIMMIVSTLASCVVDKNDVTIVINATSDTLKKGESIAIVAVASNGQPVTLSVDRNDVAEIVNGSLRVKDSATITADVEVTVAATLNDDPTVNSYKKFTVKADVERVRIVLNATSDKIGVNGQILFSAVASDNSAVNIKATGDNADLVKIENNILTVVGEINADTLITIEASLASDPSISTTKVITIEGPKTGAWIEITPSKYTITQASDGYAIINVSSYNNGAYTVSISGDDGKNVYYNSASQRLMVIKDVTADKEIKLTATLTDEPSVKDEVTITISPAPVVPTISVSGKGNVNTVSRDKDLELKVDVSTKEAYDLTVSDSALVKIEGAVGSEKLIVIGTNTFDKAVTITATLKSDPSVKVTETFVVLAPRVAGKVSGKNTEITSAMFENMGTKSMTVTGKLTDVYENFNEKTTIYNNYDIVVKMTEGKWYGAWNAILEGNVKGVINEDTYIKSDVSATVNGLTGHVMQRVYVNMNNELAQKPIVDYRSVPVLWENQHLWNHFGEDSVTNYVYRENESTDDYDVYEFNADKTSADVAYFLTYLSFAYTPLLSDTLDKVYLKVVKDGSASKIVGMIGYTEFIYQGASSEEDGASAVSYSKIVIDFVDVGTTEFPEMSTYSAPQNASALTQAINNMKAATNYTFKAIDKTTYAPAVDEGDYTIDGASSGSGIQTMSASKNYSAAVSPLGNGDVGLQGFVTSDAILIKKTFKYSATMDDNVFRIEHYGYYKKNVDHYDYFEYNSAIKGFEGKQEYAGTLADKLPKWNFSANIFEFVGNGGSSSEPTYIFRLKDASITRDLAMAVSMHNYATDGSESATHRFTIEVAADGSRVVSTMYPYSITQGTYLGYITTTYSEIGTTTIAEEEFSDYSPRVVSPNWVDYQLKYYYPNHTTQGAYAEGTGETILKIMFGNNWTKFPKMTVFTDAFGDNVSGPFFEWNEYANPNGGAPIYRDYFTLTARTEDHDENATITYETWKRIVDKITEGLVKSGFVKAFETPKQNPADRTDRYVSYMNEELGCQIVVENNHTRNFWIDVCYLGDRTFN